LANTTLPNDGSTFSYPTTVSAQAALGASALPCRVTDDRTRSSTFSIPVTVLLPLDSRCGAAATPIGTIQGTGALSPLVGQTVDVEALVVGDFQNSGGLSGFYIEAPSAEQDPDPATSEGLFVFSAQATSLGDRVRVRGSVSEFTSATGAVQSKLTELSNVPTAGGVQVCSVGNALPAPVDVALPIDDVAHWERYEGMLVRFTQPLVVTGNFSLGQFGQIDLATTVLFQPTQQPGSAAIWSVAADLVARSRIALDDGSTQSNAALNGGMLAPYPAPGLSATNTLRVGARVNPDGSVPLIGILDDRFGAYRIQPTSAVSFSNTPNPRPDAAAVAARAAARFRIVSANVLNFFVTLGSRGAATADELDHQRAKIVAELTASGGDVIGLSELQNFANGQTNGGTYTNAAIADLTSALAAATGRPYKYVDTIDPAKLSASNTVTDNGTDAIRSGLIYDGSAVTPVGVAALYYQQDQNRPSLAQTFQPLGGIHPEQQTFTVVVNHFRSKGSTCGLGNDDPLQGNCNGMRVSMALAVASWLGGNPTSDPAGLDRRIVAVGDFNAYFGEDPIQMFAASGYTDLIDALIGGEAYSYNFDSQAGYLDHAFANAAAGPLVKGVAELHVNADEPAALQALNTALKSAAAQAAYYAPDAFAASDHDPIVIGFNPLRGDFDDDGEITAKDQVMLLHAIQADRRGRDVADRRMDLNQDGELDQSDHAIWTRLFVAWQTTPPR
jgi:predicted extracellular nuclease